MTAGALAPAERRVVVREALSVGIATGAYGISFGALGVASGLDVWQTCALSLLMFTGGSQFAFIGIVSAGLHAAPAAIAASSLLGLRNGLYALELTQLLGVRGVRRVAAAHVTIDESTAVAIAQEDVRASRLGFWLTGLSVFTLWNLTTLVGALAGNALGDPKAWGLDAAASAAFTALLWPRLKNRDAVAIAVVAAVVAVVLAPNTAPGVPVIVAALAAFIAWRGPRRAGPATAPLLPQSETSEAEHRGREQQP
ncbi:AzlC family ABC transporter permease [Intrasporangium calvum]|uniref:AzlC family protein n=1 Tax=Intrasporangium calvum (strain ATCC 23552 / DSM 43043 / JCM 3097 / NBRC 12989 / NCIMB 10167 / NRRL B-3866 / 7 KIP) TaxID=710696 RepID=E6SE54_INTC7|nr:AzlC family ABC transporter permease [Intrasporangium calvum]ADU48702.1 AzlC family protein [Intrasporangium calvum DSM 43043]AXG13692.1 branched-chain amino acid ABC transporter permease [Intrasporangium calvum]